jgi:hypothetical protein
MLVLACWTASSSGAAISLEDKLEQLTNNYVSLIAKFPMLIYKVILKYCQI